MLFVYNLQLVMEEVNKDLKMHQLPTSKMHHIDFRNHPDIGKYVAAMVRLAWKMTIQRPQMTFNFTAKSKGEKYQDIYWNSQTSPESLVTVVYPMLYHGSHLMAKGKIYLWLPNTTDF